MPQPVEDSAVDSHNLPSPAPSTPNDPGSPKSRKRQRSHSMGTDSHPSSSSTKRTNPDASAPGPSDAQSMTAAIHESDDHLDASTRERGGGNPIAPLPPSTSGPEKLIRVDSLMKIPMQVDHVWYLVARDWYKRWRRACSGHVHKEGPLEDKDLGPVDNSSLVDKSGNLISNCVEGVDVEFVPADVWTLFETWYGKANYTLPRKVIARGIMEEKTLELHPPRLRALRLSDRVTSVTGSPIYVYVSGADTVKKMFVALANALRSDGEPSETPPYRVWKLAEAVESEGSLYPASQILMNGDLMRETEDSLNDALVETDDVFVVEFQENGKWLVDLCETTIGTQIPIFKENDFFSKMSNTMSKIMAPATSGPAPAYSNSFDREPSFHSFSPVATRAKAVVEPGTIGLGNVGNTCFMNSALQCLAHTKELSDYFLLGVYKEELNPDNPLGMHGAIAETFGALLHRIWSSNSTASSYTPREFKQQLQRFAPQFSGYQQHDSQELVAFLLDGLHEDLNRVLKKPYVEKPDWEGGGKKELVELARRSWEGYMMRNDSVIVDLFQGQYQSTLVCPECQKVSITFDPFMYLTLPLPVQKKWRHVVYYVPWDLEKPHMQVPVEMKRDASFKDLRNLLGRWMGVSPENLLTLEIFNHGFYKNLDDLVACGDMTDNDIIVCFELPCNSQQSRTYKKQPDDPFIIPLFLSEVAPLNRFTYSRNSSLFGYPSVVMIDQQQATDLGAIHEAIVERLQRWTVNARELYTWEADSTSVSVDEVPIQIRNVPPVDSVTEIKDNGEIVTLEEPQPGEGDITDEKSIVLQDEGDLTSTYAERDVKGGEPRKLHAKEDIFKLLLQSNRKDYGAGISGYGPLSTRYERWEDRVAAADTHSVLLREGDAFVCEFDENMKAFFFGDERTRWEHARWDQWEEFVHPEYMEAKQAAAAVKAKGLTLQDCLAEFTKEEQLGEDDLWYCPRCKKHQQATKKFDLWKVPDVLVVHLKRFSNNRILRDKVDAFVDFPLQDLVLTEMVGELKVAKGLMAEGVDIEPLGLRSLEEDMVYDLYAVSEHIGGLGGGHYRAYAMNYPSGKWYLFDDSFVTEARATDAVNSNAYLLFYKRRTGRPLGGKTHLKVENARLNHRSPSPETIAADTQLPTPPNEFATGMSMLSAMSQDTHHMSSQASADDWPMSSISLSAPSASAMEDVLGPETYDDPLFPTSYNFDPLQVAGQQFDYPDPPSKGSPTSSIEAQVDDDEGAPYAWRSTIGGDSPESDWPAASSDVSDVNPFTDADTQMPEETDTSEMDGSSVRIEDNGDYP